MDDRQKRLQALQASNPPLRASAAPKWSFSNFQERNIPVGPAPVKSKIVQLEDKIASATQAKPGDSRSNVRRLADTVNFLDGGKTFNNPVATDKDNIGIQYSKNMAKANLGGLRSLAGVEEGVSGFIDLITPGKGTNRFTKKFREAGKELDKYATAVGGDQSAYKTAQGVTDVATLAIPGAGVSKVTQAPKVAGFLGKLGKTGEFLAKALPFLVETAGDTAQNAGVRTARGEDNSLKTLGLDAGLSVATAGLLEGGKYSTTKLAQFLAKETDAATIKQMMPEISDETADLLARTDDPKVIEDALTSAEKVRMSEVNLNSKQAVKDPVVAKTATGTSPDALTTVLDTITKSTDTKDIRKLVDQILPNMSTGQKKRLTDVLSKTTDDNEVMNAIADAVDKKPGIVKTSELEANTVPLGDQPGVIDTPPVTEPQTTQVAPGSPQAASDAVSTQSGISDANVSNVQSEGSVKAQEGNLGAEVSQNADNAVKPVKELAQATPSVQNSAREITDKLSEASATVRAQGKINKKTRAERMGSATDSFKNAGGGVEGYKAKLSALKGKFENSKFTPLDMPVEKKSELIDYVANLPGLRGYDKLNAQTALMKIFGDYDSNPTKGDVKVLKEIFGEDFAKAVEDGIEDVDNSRSLVAQIAGLPKSLMSSFDLSAGVRQGGVLGSRFPKEWKNAFTEQIKYMGNEEAYKAGMQEIVDRPTYGLMERAKLAVTGASEQIEEAFTSNLLEEIPGLKQTVGKVTGASDRAYTGMLTRLRADVFDKIIKDIEGSGIDLDELDDKTLQDIGRFVNTASGRGDLGKLEKYSRALGDGLFSPRLWKSRLDMLNPVYYAKLDPVARKYALQSAGSFATLASSVLGAAALAGLEVETDARSADFLKIKKGNSRFDILGGFQQNLVFAHRMITGEKKNSETGEITKADGSYGSPSRLSLATDMLENKANPIIGTAIRIAKGKDRGGNDINPLTEVAKLFVPLNIMSAIDTYKDTGSIGQTAAQAAVGTVGVGVQTYGQVPTKNQGTTPEGEKKYVGKVEDNMVTDDNGEVILDSKGKPTTVKFEKDASELEKQALKDDARKGALTEKMKADKSTEDQALLKLSKEQRTKYLEDGKINQDKFNELEQFDQDVKNLDGVDIPKELKSTSATDFYKNYNSKTKANQEKYLTESSPEAEDITAKMNKDLPEGVTKLKPTNKLAKLYADYEIDINKEGVSEIDKRNKLKTFLGSALKQDRPENVQGIYNEGGSDDLKYFIDQGGIDKEELNQAIQLDNELYNSGISGSLEFSKKFRTSMGYDTPDSKGGSGGGGGGSGGKNAIGALPSLKTSGSNFKAVNPKSRVKIKRTAPRPTGSAKKISIRL